jgi:hypothetical protein
MDIVTWWFWGLLLVVLVALYLNQTAGRLDRLHIKVDQARAALDEQLLLRSSVASDVSTSGLLDPATSLVLAEAAHEARSAAAWGRAQAQSDLTGVLALAFADPEDVEMVRATAVGSDLLDELASVTRRVQLASQFLDDAVRSCARVRGQRIVRWLHLAGRAPWPAAESFDDEPPAALVAA